MIDEPGWTAGRISSSRPVRGPLASSRRSLQIFERSRECPERAAEGGDVAERLHELHAVGADAQQELSLVAQLRDHLCRIVRLSVDARPDGGAADAEVAQVVGIVE
jgi:hypothetical protein